MAARPMTIDDDLATAGAQTAPERHARLLGMLGDELSAEIAEVAAASRRRPT